MGNIIIIFEQPCVFYNVITATMLRNTNNLLKTISKSRINSATAYYHQNVIDHYENPRNVGSFEKNDKSVGTGLVGAPACGDVMKLQINVDAKFKTFGCGSAIASSSLATEWIKGKQLTEA